MPSVGTIRKNRWLSPTYYWWSVNWKNGWQSSEQLSGVIRRPVCVGIGLESALDIAFHRFHNLSSLTVELTFVCDDRYQRSTLSALEATYWGNLFWISLSVTGRTSTALDLAVRIWAWPNRITWDPKPTYPCERAEEARIITLSMITVHEFR